MNQALLTITGAGRHYDGRKVVDGASLQLHPGRITCLLGPSGCGKSTLLRLIAGLEELDEGQIELAGTLVSAPGFTLPPEQRSVGLVFQDLALFPHLTALENVMFGIRQLPQAQRRERAQSLLERFHVGHLAGAYPHTLSGGEQQRVAIARALAREPALLLLDEPFSGLDGHLREAVRSAVLADLRALGAAVLMVTHDPEEAMQAADDLVLMAEGHILQIGPPEECYRHPVSVEAGRLLGELVVTGCTVQEGKAASPLGTLDADGLPDGPARLLLRPEAITLLAQPVPGGPGARVASHSFAGAWHRVVLEVDGQLLDTRLLRSPPPVGSRCGITLDPGLTALLPGTGDTP